MLKHYIVPGTLSPDTGDNVGLNTGEIDVAERDSRSIRCGRYMDDIDVVVATLIAAVTFQAALQTPGGYEQNDFHKGMAVLIKQFAFNVFVIADPWLLLWHQPPFSSTFGLL